MTDFQFTNNSGVNVTFRTDFIGDAASITGGENVTVCDILGLDTDTNNVFVNWQKVKYTIGDFKAFATANSLGLKAIPVSKPGVATATLV